MQLTRLAEAFRSLGYPVAEGEPMSRHTSFKVGGPADMFVTVPDGKGAAAVLYRCREAGIPVFVMGNGSNLLVSDEGIEGVVLKIETTAPPASGEAGEIVCPAGLPVKKLCLFARDQALSGLEFAFGIPGTVGGGVYMNAGAYDGCMADVLKEVRVLTPAGDVCDLGVDELDLGYRHSRIADEGLVVLSATFALTRADGEKIRQKMDDLTHRREEKQPLDLPSAGSTFKRPEGHFAGKLITDAGLRGYQVGGAAVSKKHAGFVVNVGGATAAVHAVIEHVQAEVERQFGVRLQPEVRFLG